MALMRVRTGAASAPIRFERRLTSNAPWQAGSDSVAYSQSGQLMQHKSSCVIDEVVRFGSREILVELFAARTVVYSAVVEGSLECSIVFRSCHVPHFSRWRPGAPRPIRFVKRERWIVARCS